MNDFILCRRGLRSRFPSLPVAPHVELFRSRRYDALAYVAVKIVSDSHFLNDGLSENCLNNSVWSEKLGQVREGLRIGQLREPRPRPLLGVPEGFGDALDLGGEAGGIEPVQRIGKVADGAGHVRGCAGCLAELANHGHEAVGDPHQRLADRGLGGVGLLPQLDRPDLERPEECRAGDAAIHHQLP